MKASPVVHTRTSMRKLLGEAGYIEVPDSAVTASRYGMRVTLWQRGHDKIWLNEPTDNTQPYLSEEGNHVARIIPASLGVRNPNIHNDKRFD